MILFRNGLLLAMLLLSACSMPVVQETSNASTKPNTVAPILPSINASTKPNTVASILPSIEKKDTVKQEAPNIINTTPSSSTLLAKLNEQIKIANHNYTELKHRTGNAPSIPKLQPTNPVSSKEFNQAIQALRSYISKTNTDIAVLDARVNERKKMAVNGDLIQIFLSDTDVSDKEKQFKAQPVVGQWIRGESQVVRLKDSFLFDSSQSEDLEITFAESYQLIINDTVIGTVNPNRGKNSALFNIVTTKGKIKGKLDYRVINTK